MQKEILKSENIKSDLLEVANGIKKDSYELAIYAAVFVLIGVLCIKIAAALVTVFALIGGISFSLALYFFIKSVKMTGLIKSNQFTVKTDVLKDSLKGYTEKRVTKVVSKPYILYFESGAKFSMTENHRKPDCCYHKWSSMYRLDCVREFELAKKGDIFFTVSLTNPKAPNVIYNSRLFDYIKENDD